MKEKRKNLSKWRKDLVITFTPTKEMVIIQSINVSKVQAKTFYPI